MDNMVRGTTIKTEVTLETLIIEPKGTRVIEEVTRAEVSTTRETVGVEGG